MSEKKTETLEIFEPLKTYFNILCENNCFNYDDCKELINVLTTVDCQTKDGGKLTKNFTNALSTFAFRLRSIDLPIGVYTIKNRLKEIFKKYNPLEDDFVENVVNDVSGATNLNDFKMDDFYDDTDLEKTYEKILTDVFNVSKDADSKDADSKDADSKDADSKDADSKDADSKDADSIFEIWFDKVFDSYIFAEKYFEIFIDKKLELLDSCEKKLLNEFFEVKLAGSKTRMTVDEYIKNKDELLEKKPRLNVIMDGDKPKLFKLFPSNVINALETYITSGPDHTHPLFYVSGECYKEYKLKMTSTPTEKEEFKVSNPKAVLDWFKAEARGVSNRGVKEEEVLDSEDEIEYSDDSGNFKFPGSFDNVVNYKDNWRADMTGKLWKKDDKGKFVEYTDKELEEDAKSFQSSDGHCGRLCIFSNPDECGKFFERMMKRDSLSMEELSGIINNKDFVRDYNKLKENIIEVNPLFVVGTLRMFGFDKYTELRDDGTKVVRIESFTRWWNRHKDKLLTLEGTKHTNNPPFDPEPPANLELFFKLLILYINNNEFVLNPQTKQLTTSKTVSVKKIRPFEMLKDSSGIYKPNPNYDKELAIYEGRASSSSSSSSRPESLSSLVDIMRKNSQFGSRTISMGHPENRLNLSTLLGLMIGITNGGHIRLGRESQFSTGKGYLFGGSDEMLPCFKNATEIYDMGVKALEKKGKSLSEKEKNEITNELSQLSQLEQTVYKKLNTMARYVKVINVMNDEAKNSNVTNDLMAEVVNEYESSSNKLAVKSDSIISMLLKKLFDEKNAQKSNYSKLN
jgi:hypothetical protein